MRMMVNISELYQYIIIKVGYRVQLLLIHQAVIIYTVVSHSSISQEQNRINSDVHIYIYIYIYIYDKDQSIARVICHNPPSSVSPSCSPIELFL